MKRREFLQGGAALTALAAFPRGALANARVAVAKNADALAGLSAEAKELKLEN